MPDSQKNHAPSALQAVVSFVPWVVSMYILYWLEYGQIWTTETAHRGKISVAILLAGMAMSFLVYSYFNKHAGK